MRDLLQQLLWGYKLVRLLDLLPLHFLQVTEAECRHVHWLRQLALAFGGNRCMHMQDKESLVLLASPMEVLQNLARRPAPQLRIWGRKFLLTANLVSAHLATLVCNPCEHGSCSRNQQAGAPTEHALSMLSKFSIDHVDACQCGRFRG